MGFANNADVKRAFGLTEWTLSAQAGEVVSNMAAPAEWAVGGKALVELAAYAATADFKPDATGFYGTNLVYGNVTDAQASVLLINGPPKYTLQIVKGPAYFDTGFPACGLITSSYLKMYTLIGNKTVQAKADKGTKWGPTSACDVSADSVVTLEFATVSGGSYDVDLPITRACIDGATTPCGRCFQDFSNSGDHYNPGMCVFRRRK